MKAKSAADNDKQSVMPLSAKDLEEKILELTRLIGGSSNQQPWLSLAGGSIKQSKVVPVKGARAQKKKAVFDDDVLGECESENDEENPNADEVEQEDDEDANDADADGDEGSEDF